MYSDNNNETIEIMNTNSFDKNFPFSNTEIRMLYANAVMLDVSKFDTHISNHFSPKVFDICNERKVSIRYALGRAYFLITGKTLQPNE